jgi:nicotinamidase/pyrazinamidase
VRPFAWCGNGACLNLTCLFRGNKVRIGEIFVTLDSHHKKHIAHKAFWSSVENDVEGKGAEPTDFLEITEDDLQNGKWYPKDCSLQVLPLSRIRLHQNLTYARFARSFFSNKSYCLKYTRRLESSKDEEGMEKFKLRIWPDHCLIGTDGHAIEPNIQEAIREWDIHHYAKTVKHIHKVTTRQYSSYKLPGIGMTGIIVTGHELLD